MSKKQQKKNAPEFIHGKVTPIGRVHKGNRIIYAQEVKVKNATYSDVKEQVEKMKNKLKKSRPNAMMNVAIKYESVNVPMSSKFFDVSGEVDLKAPYDYQQDEDPIQYLYIQFSI